MNLTNSLNGSVHSQGIKIDHQAWLDMGSQEWNDTDDKVKAAAYQAAKICGWTDDGLRAIIIKEFHPRVDEFTANVTLDILHELADKHPVEVDVVYEQSKETYKVRGSDKTFQL